MGKWWLWGNAPAQHDATIDDAGRWPGIVVGLRSFRAQPVTPAAAPPGWMAGNVPISGAIMPVSVAYVQRQRLTEQLHLANIGPVDDTMQRAEALQAALAASMRSRQTLPSGG